MERLRALSRDTYYDAPSFIKRAAFNRTLHFNKHFTELDDATSSLASLHMAASTGPTYICVDWGSKYERKASLR